MRGHGRAQHPTTEEELREAALGPLTEVNGPIHLAAPDPGWPAQFVREEARIRAALGSRALAVEHVGSTSVPGLVAKPILDIIVAVADSADEPAYVPALEAAGYRLRIREPAWEEHRLLNGCHPSVNLHVFSAGSAETAQMLRLRDWLRVDEADRALYAATKRALAARTWKYVQHYADAKTEVIAAILARAEAAPPGPATSPPGGAESPAGR
jgi:GrpB-like predicted nucleotidyltransferase (UPF0157 family)